MESVCAFAAWRLRFCGGREAAEMASAAARFGMLESSGAFLRPFAAYCAEPPAHAFRSLRDISMAALALSQSYRGPGNSSSSGQQTHGAVPGWPTTPVVSETAAGNSAASCHGVALRGLAQAAMPYLAAPAAAFRDVVELGHALAHTLILRPMIAGVALHEDQVIEAAMCLIMKRLHRGMHHASARDAVMAAGAAAALWPLMDHLRDQFLRPTLLDAAGAARFRCTEFSLRDLALLAAAFARAEGVPEDALSTLLNEQVANRVGELSNKDLCHFLWAAASVEGWAWQHFARACTEEAQRRNPTSYSVQDLCTLAQSATRLGHQAMVASLCDEVFRRQLCNFMPKDKAVLLWVLAKAVRPHAALVRMTVRSLAVGGRGDLDAATTCTTLWALAQLWPLLGQASQASQSDPAPQMLAMLLFAPWPWTGASTSQLAQISAALVVCPLALGEAAWHSLLEEFKSIPVERCAVHELSQALLGIGACPFQILAPTQECIRQIVSELALRSRQGTTMDLDVLQLAASSCSKWCGLVPNDLQQELEHRRGSGRPWEAAADPGEEGGEGSDASSSASACEPEVLVQDGLTSPPGLSDEAKQAAAEEAATEEATTEDDAAADPASAPKEGAPVKKRVDASDIVFSSFEEHETEAALDTDIEVQGGAGTDTDEDVCFGHSHTYSTYHGWGHFQGVPRGRCRSKSTKYVQPGCFGHSHCQASAASHGHDHGHGHAHVHGRCRGGSSDFDHSPARSPMPRRRRSPAPSFAASFMHCEPQQMELAASLEPGEVIAAHTHVDENTDALRHNADPHCSDETCCVKIPGSSCGDSVGLRLNAHCSFPGHCVQMKNTFVHINCNYSDSESESDCLVCRMTRSQSCDVSSLRTRKQSEEVDLSKAVRDRVTTS